MSHSSARRSLSAIRWAARCSRFWLPQGGLHRNGVRYLRMELRMSGLDSARSGRRGDPEGRPLEGIHQAPMTEFFTRTFMQKYTDVPTFEALLEAGGHTLESWATTATFPDEDWERVIHKHT